MELSEHSSNKAVSYERFFKENYDSLKRWALQITTYDHELAEDLVHDIYIRFSLRKEPPREVESLPGYVYAALRNAHVSYLRSTTKKGSRQLSMYDNDFIEDARLTIDPRSIIKVHDDLRAICDFACNRKPASVSASILILRFFHGYFSAEVARVTGRSKNAVEARLLKCRHEISLNLFDPSSSGKPNSLRALLPSNVIATNSDLLLELRERVFTAADGRCLSTKDLNIIYKKSVTGLTRDELSHLVSCRKCLYRVNDLLRMPQLSERHPLDTLGAQTTVENLQCSRPLAASASSMR